MRASVSPSLAMSGAIWYNLHMKKCRITVMRKVEHTDLMALYEKPYRARLRPARGRSFHSQRLATPRGTLRERVGEHVSLCACACKRRRKHLRRLDEEQKVGNDILQRWFPSRKFLHRGARRGRGLILSCNWAANMPKLLPFCRSVSATTPDANITLKCNCPAHMCHSRRFAVIIPPYFKQAEYNHMHICRNYANLRRSKNRK